MSTVHFLAEAGLQKCVYEIEQTRVFTEAVNFTDTDRVGGTLGEKYEIR